MTCDVYNKVHKILMKWDKKMLVDIIADEMSCCELEQFLKDNPYGE